MCERLFHENLHLNESLVVYLTFYHFGTEQLKKIPCIYNGNPSLIYKWQTCWYLIENHSLQGTDGKVIPLSAATLQKLIEAGAIFLYIYWSLSIWWHDNRFEVNWPPEPTLVIRWISKFFLFGALPSDTLKIKHTKNLKEIPSRHFLENLL